MREAAQIPISKIIEPAKPMRFEMDNEKFNELVESIRRQGLLQPMLVLSRGEQFEVIAGHRRLLASRAAELQVVPCIICDGEENNPFQIMLDENLIREDVSPLEEGELFKTITTIPGIPEEEIQRRIGKPLGYIYSRVELVNGDPNVAVAVHKKLISLGVARELNKVKNEGYRKMYLERAVQGGCTIELAKTWVSTWRMSDAGQTPAQQMPQQPLPGPEHVAQPMACWLCGGTDDNWNLEPVWIHHEELRMLRMAREMQLQREATAGGGA